MNVKNRKCVRHLSMKALLAARKRNTVAIIAIALTALMFTSLFTVLMSLNASYQTYQFRQVGGYAHGTFKEITEEQGKRIASHPKVKETGIRTVIGIINDGVFAECPAEVSYMDENFAEWSYAKPTAGRMPEKENEVAMDTGALELLGITPKLGAEVTLTYSLLGKQQVGESVTDTFKLVGFWEDDSLLPAHFINISKAYAEKTEKLAMESGMGAFRTDLEVMLASEFHLEEQMQQIDTDLGYTWDDIGSENNVRFGVNGVYTSLKIDSEILVAIAAFLLLVVLVGFLIIFNIFQISVAGDIRFYGLLKTLGVTPRQLRRIIRYQAMLLCLIGIPIGLLLGFAIGAVITPIILESTALGSTSYMMSTSPFVFLFAAVFAFVTVLLSCWRPGRVASKVSPVEAVRYTEITGSRRKARRVRGAKIPQMALANLGRNKSKTALVVLSLSLSVVLWNLLFTFVNGFDMEKYLSEQICADFIVSSPDYFRCNESDQYINLDDIAEIEKNTEQSLAGMCYANSGEACAWVTEETFRNLRSGYASETMIDKELSVMEKRNGCVKDTLQVEGLDPSLFEKLTVYDGSLEPLYDEKNHAIAMIVSSDDGGKNIYPENHPNVGDNMTVTYAKELSYIDSRTGELCDEDTPEEYLKEVLVGEKEVEYTVCALVEMPASMSYRYHFVGRYEAALSADALAADSGQELIPLVYLFDTPDEASETEAEEYLAKMTADKQSSLMYESKATIRAEFNQFKNMFLLVGGLLCAVIAIVGILNFINAIITGIISRKREFAVLQAVGMTAGQLKKMLIYEGAFYALGAVGGAMIVLLAFGGLIGNAMENVFWFFSYHMTMLPAVWAIPVFMILGVVIPLVIYHAMKKQTIVERLKVADS